MAKVENVILVNSGVCNLIIDGEVVKPDAEIEVSAKFLELPGFETLISRGELTIKDNTEANKEVKERVKKRKKADPDEGKTVSQLEDGGEY